MGSLTVGGRLPPLEHELVVSRQPAVSAAAPQQPTAISSPYMHLSECFTGGHPPPPLQGMLPLFKKFSSSSQQRNSTFTTLLRCSSASPSCSCCSSFISAFSRLSGTSSKLSGSSEPNIQFIPYYFRIHQLTFLTRPSTAETTPSSSPPPPPRKPPQTLSNKPLLPLRTSASPAPKSTLHLAGWLSQPGS